MSCLKAWINLQVLLVIYASKFLNDCIQSHHWSPLKFLIAVMVNQHSSEEFLWKFFANVLYKDYWKPTPKTAKPTLNLIVLSYVSRFFLSQIINRYKPLFFVLFYLVFMLRFKWNLFLNWFSIWKKKKFHHIPLIDSCYAMFIFQSSYNWTKLMACFVKNSIAGCFIFIMWHNLPNFLTIPRSKGND